MASIESLYETIQRAMCPDEPEPPPRDVFVHPMHYGEVVHPVPETLVADIQLKPTLGETDTKTGVYDVLLSPETPFAKKTSKTWHTHYTTDVTYIRDTQKVLKGMSAMKGTFNLAVRDNGVQAKLIESWDRVCDRDMDSFLDTYHYISINPLRQLNKNPTVLQAVNLYVMASPVMALLLPIISLIFPFLILRLRGIRLNASAYADVLKNIISRHPVGQVFYNMGSVSWDKVAYFLFTVGMYFVQIYQNVRSCIRYYGNITHVHETIRVLQEFTNQSMENVRAMRGLCETSALESKNYRQLIDRAESCVAPLEAFATRACVVGETWGGVGKYLCTGEVMRLFYELRTDQPFNEAVNYMIGFNGYIENLIALSGSLDEGSINPVEVNHGERLSFEGGYHPLVVPQNTPASPTTSTHAVKNSYSLSKNIIISGPNASGKTTLLKSTLLNALLCQQIGGGFFDSCVSPLYDMFHCYLNIPDTSDRDSLFQAEARRCKDMLQTIEGMPSSARHLCVMDELFSGTNPEEAAAGSYSFLEYLAELKGASFVMTTHYTKLCRMVKRSKLKIRNCNMGSSQKDAGMVYTYRIVPGTSKIKGGASVIREMGFPEKIISTMHRILTSGKHNKEPINASK